MEGKTALLLGATGLTGSFLLNRLAASNVYSKVIVPVRKTFSHKSSKVEVVEVDFKNLQNLKERFKADDVYCCLGTTIAVAKTKENFRFVDYELPLQFAQIALEQGAQSFQLMSSTGANAKSGNFYLKTKGEVEEAIAALSYTRINIFRPSMLLGPRKENRSGESIGKTVMVALNFLWRGPLKNYKPIESETVAKAMLQAGATGFGNGVTIFESAEIEEFVK